MFYTEEYKYKKICRFCDREFYSNVDNPTRCKYCENWLEVHNRYYGEKPKESEYEAIDGLYWDDDD